MENTDAPAPRQGSEVFDLWQPQYAKRGIPTFPVRFVDREGKIDKVPAITGYMKIGLRLSTALTRKFGEADGIGFALGNSSGLAVIDVDTDNENAVAEVLARHGQSPLIARTPSGGHHVFYKHDGRQRRRVRDPYWRERGTPVDILGNGFVVAPPSLSPKGIYRFVQGDLDDLRRLPVLRTGKVDRPAIEQIDDARAAIPRGTRNKELWRYCMRQAKRVSSFAELLEQAHSFNQRCDPPLEASEMTNTAQSAWGYTQRGENRFGQHGAYFPIEEVMTMLTNDQDAFMLLAFLRANQGPLSEFMCTNGLAEQLGWRRQRLAEARHRLIKLGHIRCIRQSASRRPALFEWA